MPQKYSDCFSILKDSIQDYAERRIPDEFLTANGEINYPPCGEDPTETSDFFERLCHAMGIFVHWLPTEGCSQHPGEGETFLIWNVQEQVTPEFLAEQTQRALDCRRDNQRIYDMYNAV